MFFHFKKSLTPMGIAKILICWVICAYLIMTVTLAVIALFPISHPAGYRLFLVSTVVQALSSLFWMSRFLERAL